MSSTILHAVCVQRHSLFIILLAAALGACPVPNPEETPGTTGSPASEAPPASTGDGPTDGGGGNDTSDDTGYSTPTTTNAPTTGGCDSDICCSPGAALQCHDDNIHSFDSCGNDEGPIEACAGGQFCVDTSASTAQCQAPTEHCPNKVIDPDENCDGDNLGGATCISLGFGPGDLTCNPLCQFDTAGCCSEQATFQCLGDDVRWFDSCGAPGEIKEQCPRGLTCTNTSPTTAECDAGPQPCGNGVLDADETCDGANLGGATCSSLGFTSGTLACSDSCNLDTGGCVSETCKIVASPGIGSWTPAFSPQVDCTCSESDPDCHAIYQGRVDAIAGNTATMSFRKSGGGGPSVNVDYWVVVGAEAFPACHDLFAYINRKMGKWSDKLDPLQTDVEIWPNMDEFNAAAAGATKRLFIMTGGSDDPGKKTWFQKQSILFTKVCN